MTTNHFFGGWEGVCALGKKKKKKKKGKHGGRSVSGQNPVWRVDVGGGALCVRGTLASGAATNRIVQCVK